MDETDESNRERQLADWLEGQLSDDETAALLDKLKEDSDFRREAAKSIVIKRNLVQLQVSEGDFTKQIMGNLVEEESVSVTGNVIAQLQLGRRRQHQVLGWAASLAAAAAIVLGGFVWLSSETDVSNLRIVATESIGTLKAERIYDGDRVRLKRGLIELDLGGRARVVIEAPASFAVHSIDHITLFRGRCFAEMEKGDSGLVVETPSGKVLDLGTRFAVDVATPETMEVHVFDGEVEVSEDDKKTLIKQGEAVAFDQGREQVARSANQGNFVPRVPRGARREATYIHWSFDEGQGAVVVAGGNDRRVGKAKGAIHIIESGEMTSPGWIEGVSGSALEFDGRGGWVKTDHPGVSGKVSRTVAGWIRIPLDWGNREGDKAPLVSWGLIKALEETGRGWMLSIADAHPKSNPEIFGRLRLSLGEQQVVGATDLRDGKWHHVAAVVLQEDAGPTALLYVDGGLENVTRNTIESMRTNTQGKGAEPIRFGRQLYWDDSYLRGALDEFYLFDAALSGDQVRAVMRGEQYGSKDAVENQ